MADCRKCKHNYKSPGDEPRCNLMCDGESDFEPITKYDQIHAMSIEELAEWLTKITDDAQLDAKTKCNYQWGEWLKSEVKESE
jgi:hypothetical protein